MAHPRACAVPVDVNPGIVGEASRASGIIAPHNTGGGAPLTTGVTVQLAVDTLAATALYALVALAASLAYNGTGVLHLAIGQVAVGGGLVAAVLQASGIPLVLAIVAGLGVGAALSAVAERTLVAPRQDRPLIAAALLVASAVVLQETLSGLFPKPAYQFPTTSGTLHLPGNALVRASDLLTITVVVVVAVAAALVVRSPRLGAALRVTASAPVLAERLGVGTARVRTVSFAVSGAFATVAVLLAAGRFPLAAGGGSVLAIRGIAASAAGRMTSPPRALGAALLIAAVEVVGDYQLGGGGEFLCDAAAVLLVAASWRR